MASSYTLIALHSSVDRLCLKPSLRAPAGCQRRNRLRGRVRGLMGLLMFTRIFQSKPRIREELCRRCGICIESCPV